MVAEADNGEKKYYLTKKADGPEARPSRGGAVPSASNNIIAEQKASFNPFFIIKIINYFFSTKTIAIASIALPSPVASSFSFVFAFIEIKFFEILRAVAIFSFICSL